MQHFIIAIFVYVFAVAAALCWFHRKHLDRHKTWLSKINELPTDKGHVTVSSANGNYRDVLR